MRRWVTILVAMLAVSLVAGGCFGGDDDDTTASERPDDSVTSTTLAQPGVTTSTTAVAPTTPTPTPTPTRVPGQPLTYVVQAGDLLGTIAQQFGVSVDAIVEANNLDDPNLLFVGQELIIPPPEGETTGDTTTGDTTTDGATTDDTATTDG